MLLKVLTIAITAAVALCAPGCGSIRKCRVESVECRVVESSKLKIESVRDSVMVVIHDTVMVVTTITVRQNEAGDTVRYEKITDKREKITDNREEIKDKREEIRRDTVYIEKTVEQERVEVKSKAGFLPVLKWFFAVILSILILIIVIKIRV